MMGVEDHWVDGILFQTVRAHKMAAHLYKLRGAVIFWAKSVQVIGCRVGGSPCRPVNGPGSHIQELT